jgi:DNA-binding NarL/FixJ family response regulator
VTIRVAIADDQALVRSGFRLILEGRPDLAVVGEAEDGAAAAALVEELAPDVILLDIRMPVLDGIEATRRIVASGSRTRILVLTTFDLDEYVYGAVRAGASGFLLKDVRPGELVDAIRVVASGNALLGPTAIARLLARGLSNAEIASTLVVSEATVKTHVSNILRKLGVRDRVQAVIAAFDAGLAQPRLAAAPESVGRGLAADRHATTR